MTSLDGHDLRLATLTAGDPGPPRSARRPQHARPKATRAGDEAVVVTATGVVAVVNYSYTLILLWLLPTREFAEVGSISAILLICGTVAGAALPWVLAQEVLRSGRDQPRRRIAVTYCLFATVLQGAAAGLATCLIAVHYASGDVLVAAFCSVFLIFMGATATGYFQGLQRFRLIALLKVAEVVVKLGAGVGLIALGAGASGAVAGFALGAGVVTAVGLVAMAPHLSWSWTALAGRTLWASTQGLMAIQAGVAVLASMDIVIGSLVLGTTPALATYQAANIIGRVPVFIGSALSVVIFPRMIAGRHHPHAVIRDSVTLYLRLCVPIAVVAATLPRPVVGALFPARYGDVGAILPWAALAGLVMGVVNMTTTYFQAAGRFRRTTSLLAFGVALCAALDVFGLELHGVVGLAAAVGVGAAVVSAGLLREISRTWPGALGGVWRPGLAVVIGCLPLVGLRHHLALWALWAAGCAALFGVRGLLGATRPHGHPPQGAGAGSGGGGNGGAPVRPRILHLGYEDPRRPGAGGGSVRTHEINRRLADRFDIVVACARYRGCRPRTEDGVRYVHIGAAIGDFPARLAYFASLPYALVRYRSDLVVEDFGAPFSSVAVPWMTGRPVLGVVQWLFAREKSAQYHLPFHWVERIGVRSHRSMVAVSEDLGGLLVERNPRADVTVVRNGLDRRAFEPHEAGERSGIVSLGRLEIAQKGLDLLIEAYASIAGYIRQDLVLGGDGPDRDQLEAMAERLGVADRVRFVGRVPAEDRFSWLAGADIVAMPSRYETFGMVAAEALAVGTPVVSFDIPCLRSLVDDEVGVRVPAFDVPGLARALQQLATDGERRRRLGGAGPERVADLNWDELATQQGAVYQHLLDEPVRPPVASGEPPANDRSGSEGGSVVDRLESQRSATPGRVAVIDGDDRWTYDVLHDRAGRIARALADRGVVPGDAVGVCLPRSKEAIASIIGLWRAGAVYVPLDPEYPTSRLSALCAQAGVAVLIGDGALLESVQPALPHVDPMALTSEPDPPMAGAGAPTSPPGPDDTAYILFTSGSTGRPKAVQVSHRSLAHVLDWVRSTLSDEELAVCATSISFSFDPFVLEVFGPLVVGGTVRVVPHALALADRDTGATMLANTPSVLRELLRAGRLPPTVRTVVVGGETLSPSLATELLGCPSVRRLINTYGPTEATVLTTSHEVTLPVTGPVPIGRCLPDMRVVLLDEERQEVADGTIGEIYIAGPQLATGYVGDPEGTEERFIEWTGPHGAPLRIYRTGDLGRRDRDGTIHFCGRQDRQLKLRGYRIEPGEIESTLCRHDAIDQAVVTVSGTGERRRLVAHVATSAGDLEAPDVREWLRGLLPSFMVPAHIVVLGALPTNAHGKVAVELLPPWQSDGGASGPPASPTAAGAGPEADAGDAAVATVARLAGQILETGFPIRGEHDFLDDLGGSSLALFQLLSAMETEFGCRIEIGRILEDTSISGLARLAEPRPDGPSYLSVHDDGTRRPVYMIHAYLGTALRYRQLGGYLAHDRPLVGIQVQGFDSISRPTRTSIDQMATEAAQQIRALQATGPYVVGGHSAGGLVAYETARRLVGAGESVPLVILLDSPVPRSRLHYLWAEAVLNWPDFRAASAAQRRRHLSAIVSRRHAHAPSASDADRVGATISRSHRASNLAVRHYKPGPYRGVMAVMRTTQGTRMALGKDDLGWTAVARGSVTSIAIPGLHNTIFEAPQLGVIGDSLNRLLDDIDDHPGRYGLTPEAAPTSPF